MDQPLAQSKSSFREAFTDEQNEQAVKDIKVTEVSFSEDNIDQEFLNKVNTFADDYLLSHNIPLAARTDIKAETAQPILYLETENGENYKEFEIPLVTKELNNWNYLKKDIENVVELWKRGDTENQEAA